MKNKLNVLLVDDDPALVEMHSAFLDMQGHSIMVAEDGEKALSILDIYNDKIGVVVTDVRMPNVDGYELCAKLKSQPETENIPVIFVSALTSLDEKMKGYSVGADDYITKPVDEQVLNQKIKVLLDIREKQAELNKKASESHNVAMQAMSYSSELGQVIEFYNNVMNSSSYDSVATVCFEHLSAQGLISILKIFTPTETLDFSASKIVSPLESNVLELARDKGRFFDFGARTIMNYPHFSILVKNMPFGEEERYGRIKDMLGMLGNGLEAKISQINYESILREKNSAIVSIRNSINSIKKSFTELQDENISAIEDMNEKVQKAIMTLGLTETQETNIQNITESCLDRSNKAFYRGLSIAENLNNIDTQFLIITGNSTAG